MTPFEIIVAAIALTLLIAVIALVRLSVRVGRTADEVSKAARRVTELTPVVQELIHSSHAEVEALRALTKTTNGIASDVRSVSAEASAVTSQLLQGLESGLIDRYRALYEGARAGVGVLRRYRSSNRSSNRSDNRSDNGTQTLRSGHSEEIAFPHK